MIIVFQTRSVKKESQSRIKKNVSRIILLIPFGFLQSLSREGGREGERVRESEGEGRREIECDTIYLHIQDKICFLSFLGWLEGAEAGDRIQFYNKNLFFSDILPST